jgi:hypothetical protein
VLRPKKKKKNTTYLIELAGKIKSDSMLLSSSIGQIALKLGSSLASSGDMELKAKVKILSCGIIQGNKIRLDCGDIIEISKASSLEINTKVEVLAKENILIEGNINCSAPSSVVQIGEIENHLSLSLNGGINPVSTFFYE